MKFLSTKQTSEKWGISPRRIQTLCASNRISGAMRVGKAWIIPSDAEKPKDARINNGKYLRERD